MYCEVVKSGRLRVRKDPHSARAPGLCEGMDPLVTPEQLPVLLHGDGEGVAAGPVPDQKIFNKKISFISITSYLYIIPHCPGVDTVLVPALHTGPVQHLCLTKDILTRHYGRVEVIGRS